MVENDRGNVGILILGSLTALIIIAAAIITSLTSGCAPGQLQQTKAGQLFCAISTATGPLVIALADASGVPVIVTNQLASDVARGCALVSGVPVVPPPNPAAAPIVASKTTLPTS